MRPTHRTTVATLVALAALAAVAGACGGDRDEGSATTTQPTATTRPIAASSSSTTSPSTTAPSSIPTTAATASTTRPSPPPSRPPTTLAPTTTTTPVDRLAPFRGLGTWIDVLDWSPSYDGAVSVRPADVAAMADVGVRTLYIQTARYTKPEDVLDPAILRQFVDAAHREGMAVVGWYLPTHVDPATDLRRLVAIGGLGVDAIAVDIESLEQPDISVRNRHLIELSAALRARFPELPLGAIVMPAVVIEDLNTTMWPSFPYRDLVPHYDAWLPMAYWGRRTEASGWHDGARYVGENVDRLRARTGRPDLPVHAIGGVANEIDATDVAAMAQAANARGLLGISLYDWQTTPASFWPILRGGPAAP